MQIFLSYASEDRQLAEQVQLALTGAGYYVFFDRESLPAGGDYHARIQTAVQRAEIFVFLISPDAVAQGSYALTELRHARSKWPHPKDRVIPAILRATQWNEIPNYLKSVTVLEPEGNVPAEVVAAVNVLDKLHRTMEDRSERGPIQNAKPVEPSGNSYRLQILVAVIGLVGVIGASLIANWDKIFGQKPVPADSTKGPDSVAVPAHSVARTGETAPPSSDLRITPLSGANRPRPLDGYEILNASAEKSGTAGQSKFIYPRGAKITLDLAHNRLSDASITLRSVELNIDNFRPGAHPECAYKAKGDKVIGAGPIKPLIYHVALFGSRVGPAMRVTDSKRRTGLIARSANFLDTDDQQLFQLSKQDDSQSFNIEVTAEEAGLYQISFTFTYSVLGETKQQRTQPAIWICYDGR